jgi:6-phosphogluconolactonase
MITSKFIAFVGTYTTGESQGLYRFIADSDSGNIESITLAAKIDNPTYLSISKNNENLYSVTKLGDSGGVAAYEITASTGELKSLNYQISAGKPPCHVSMDEKCNYVFSSNYHKGTLEVFPLNKHRSIAPPLFSVTHEGTGPNKERQDKPHVHYTSLTPDEKYLCSVDLGIDKLVVYSFSEGKISISDMLSLKPGCGPRHMVFHPNGKFAYIITELSSEIVTLEYNTSEGSFKDIQYISTLPQSYSGENLGSAIHISTDGKYLYASNRGHNSIATFRVDNSSGKLQLASHTHTGGSSPRDFALAPNGKFLFAANQDSSNIVVFSIDTSTGKLSPTGDSCTVPNPVCIKFLHV